MRRATNACSFGIFPPTANINDSRGWLGTIGSTPCCVSAVLDALALHPRYSGFAAGIVSLADISYFVALVAVAMAVTRFSFDLRRIQP